MGLKIVCHACDHVLYEGFDLIPFFNLRDKLDGKCPNCKRELAIRPLTVELFEKNEVKNEGEKFLHLSNPKNC